MSRKGKFNLLSILIEDKLIYYKSINKIKKLVAFSIFSAYDMPKIILILNELLKKRLLKTYSIQIEVSSKNRKLFLLYFEDQEKERILNSFNLIYQTLLKCINHIYFFREDSLRKKFFNLISTKISPQLDILCDKGTFSIKTKQKTIFLNPLQIRINLVSNRVAFLLTLIKLLRNLNSYGFLIFNVSIDNINGISLNCYYIDILKKEGHKKLNLEYELNSFFKAQIFETVDIQLNSFYKILWRKTITSDLFMDENLLELFIAFSIYNFQNLNLFSSQFEKVLRLNHILVHRLNPKLLLVDQSIIFLTIDKLDIELIERVLTKYIASHQIFLIVLSMVVYNKILKLEKIESLKNLKLLNVKDVINFDFLEFKKQLKNP